MIPFFADNKHTAVQNFFRTAVCFYFFF